MAITGSVQPKNGKWHAVINLYDENGKRKKKWVSTNLPIKGNKRQAEKILTEMLAEYNKRNLPYCKLTVSEYFKNWLQQIQQEVRPSTYRSYYGNMTNHIIPYFEKRKIYLQDLKPYQLEDYYKSKLQSGSKLNSSEALSPTTIKHHHQNISKALSDATRRGIISVNPATAAKTPKAEKFKAQYLNPEQIKELLVLFKGNVVELPVILCVMYGFRRGEVLGLKWNCIDFDNKTITISETLLQHIGGNYTSKPKTESSYRTLPMTDSVYNLLLSHKKLQNERKSLMGEYYIDSGYVCTLNNGEVISPNYLSRTFHSVIIKSTLPDIRLHDLRHSVASNLHRMKIPVKEVQEWLGHANPTTTLEYYTHTDEEAKQRIAAIVESAIMP